ncbi:Uncharacterised protein [Burkholderia pseudomallei]|uniref:hypothetical protein n=1 Tax=Burkholderia TaxID=32008 RepID=UPI0011AF0A0D|nr:MULTISPECIES: hypothetical protein [Burkholderia]CAJ3207925.1 Uncharacterised protein [Burkholderia pseudomallei]CAJ9440640.1 Uncharacterised protein [Burkholderia pseudomallei]
MKTIVLTPTWSGVMGVLVASLRDGTEEGKKHAEAELFDLAKKVDQMNDHFRQERESILGKKLAQLAEQGATDAGKIVIKEDKMAIVTKAGRVEWFKLNQFGGIAPVDNLALTKQLVDALESMLSIDDWHDDALANPQMIANAQAVLALGREALK